MPFTDQEILETVRMIEVPGFSLELCGGTHVARTGDIGLFRIVAETSSAATCRLPSVRSLMTALPPASR